MTRKPPQGPEMCDGDPRRAPSPTAACRGRWLPVACILVVSAAAITVALADYAARRKFAAPVGEGKTAAQAPAAAPQDMSHVLAGLVMEAASGKEGRYQDARNQSAEARRRFLADRFGLPADYPASAAPPGAVPDGAQVLMVFEDPDRSGGRMILLRVRKPVGQVLEDFTRQYAAQGWTAAPMGEGGGGRSEEGRLLRFSRGREDRMLYARGRGGRRGGEETLAALYDARY